MGAGTPLRRRKMAFYAAGMVAMTFLAISQTPDVVVSANAGADQTLAIGATITLDGTASTGETTCAWTQTTTPTGGWCIVADAAACSTTAECGVAGAYAFTLSINSGADTDEKAVTVTGSPSPLWSSFDTAELAYFLDNFAADQNDEGVTYWADYLTYGTDAIPTPPTLPTITNQTPVTCTTATGCRDALKANPGRIVRPTVDITGTIGCDETCNDVRLEIIAGINVDGIILSDLSGAANTLEISGDVAGVDGAGCLGTVADAQNFTATDIYVHGLNGSPECKSTPDSSHPISLTYPCVRCAFAHLVLRGSEGSFVNGACVFMGNEANTDLTFMNINCKAAETWSGNEDSWGYRYSGTRIVQVGNLTESWIKPNVRMAHNQYSGFWTPAALMGGDRHSVLYAPWSANSHTSVTVGGVTSNELIYAFRMKMFLSSLNPSDSGYFWGPDTTLGGVDTSWSWGGIDFTTSSDTLMSAALLATKESNANAGDGPWSVVDALGPTVVTRNPADANTHTVTDPIPAMVWTAVVDPDVGLIGPADGDPDGLTDGIP